MSDWPGSVGGLGPSFQYGAVQCPLGLASQALACLSGFSGNSGAEVANMALLLPVYLPSSFTCARMGLVNGNVSGNFDLGIYDARGTRLGSSGSTAQSGANSFQSAALGSAVTMKANTLYYLAVAQDNTTGQTLVHINSGNFPFGMDVLGLRQAVTSFPLPSSLTPATASYKRFPILLASERSVF